MRLTDTPEKIKAFLAGTPDIPKDIFVFLAILLVGAGSFTIGRISALEDSRKGELRILSSQGGTAAVLGSLDAKTAPKGGKNDEIAPEHIPQPALSQPQKTGMYVGSISGKIYHLPTCSGAKRIKDENKVWFSDKKEAEAMGYSPASNCKGI